MLTNNLSRVEAAMDAMRQAIISARRRMGEGLPLTRSQLEIVMALSDGPKTTSELARLLFVTQSAATQTIDTLVRQQLLERRPAAADRRAVQLCLTPEGRQITDRLCNFHRRHIKALLAKLTDDEIEAFISITGKLTELYQDTNPHQNQQDT